MARLRRAELETALSILGVACELEGTEPFPEPILEELRHSLGAFSAEYELIDRRSCRYLEIAWVSQDPDDVLDPDVELVWQDYWCPLFDYIDRTGDRSAKRASDVISRRRYHELPVYRQVYRPAGIEWVMMVPLPGPVGLDRSLFFCRERGTRNFSDAQRDLLEVLRPHFGRMCELAELRRRVADNGHPNGSHLTTREREIVDLVARGKTNADIARVLSVAPSTVKKHLENVYAKLGVANRAAAAVAELALHL